MNIRRTHLGFLVAGVGFGWLSLSTIMFNKQVQTIIQKEIIGIEYNTNIEFSQDSLVTALASLNIKFPHIVLAQSQIETGNFTSKIFKENHNLFGMKEAKQRVTTAKGTKRGHAHFSTWYESLLDYAFFQCRYMGKISTESEYYTYLGKNYAEDPTYIDKVKKQANKNKKLFP
jgi:uncharacterized FlgJ-related protein